MTATELKEYIINNDYVEQILYELNCGHIRNHGKYITASNPDGGNNKQAINVYLNDGLTCIDHTRNLTKNKRSHDIFDLVSYFKDCTFPEALKWVCDVLGLDYYSEPEEVPESIQILQLLKEMRLDNNQEDSTPVKPISTKILDYYFQLPNTMWEQDGIDYHTQQEFSCGYDPCSNRLTLPIYNELGDLCGVKGRWFGDASETDCKYIYLESCNKSKILYGYWQNKEYIKNAQYLLIFESEKSVLQCVSMGVRNVVACGGKTISKTQAEMLIRTGCKLCLCMDSDVSEEELKDIASIFPDMIDIYAVIDKDKLSDEKSSPSDDPSVFNKLLTDHVYKIK